MYALDGIGLNSTKLNGKVLEAAAEFMFVLLLILIAKGYTVTRARLPQASAMKLTVFACSYAVTYVSLFTYETLHFDRGQVCICTKRGEKSLVFLQENVCTVCFNVFLIFFFQVESLRILDLCDHYFLIMNITISYRYFISMNLWPVMD